MNLTVSVIVPDKVFLREQVKEIILPTLTGQMGVLKGHIPLLTGLDTGLLLFRKESSDIWSTLVVAGGFALINNNIITILVNEAELGLKIDKIEAEKSFLEAKNYLESQVDSKKKIEALSNYKKAKARLQAFDLVK